MSKVNICYLYKNIRKNLFEEFNKNKFQIFPCNNIDDLKEIINLQNIDLLIIADESENSFSDNLELVSKIENKINEINFDIILLVKNFSEEKLNKIANESIKYFFNIDKEEDFLNKLNEIFDKVLEEKKEKIKILIVDDNKDERVIISYLLKQLDIEMIEAGNGKEAQEYLYDDEISIIILDLYMPLMDGYETCKLFKSRETFKHVPIIALTSSENSNDLKRMLEAGANDFIRKPFLFEEFTARIKAQLRLKNYFDEIQMHISEEERLNQKLLEVNEKILDLNGKLEDMAITDYLTGIYNRRYILEYLEQEIERSNRYDTMFSVILFDFDNFKNVNDTYGHLVGDEALKHFCNLVSENTRKSDLMGRYGGEEFLLIMPNTTIEQVEKHANKLREVIEENPLKYGNNEKLKITVSAGCTSFYQLDKKSEDLIKRADDALLRAKNNGKNRVEKG